MDEGSNHKESEKGDDDNDSSIASIFADDDVSAENGSQLG